MKRLLVILGLWLARLGGWEPERFGLGSLIAVARHVVAQTEAELPGASGEAKRHQVYAVLLKQIPDASRRDVALAIELALR